MADGPGRKCGRVYADQRARARGARWTGD